MGSSSDNAEVKGLKRCASEVAEDSGEEESSGVTNGGVDCDDLNFKRRKTTEGKSSGGNRHPVYRGVRMRTWGKWVSEIREPKKKSRIWLGTFPTPEMAARAHDVAAISIKGKSAFLNFPNLASSLPQPASLSPRDIQAAAAAAAADFRLDDENASENNAEAANNDDEATDASNGVATVAEAACEVVSTSAWISGFLVENESLFIDEDVLFDMPNFLANMAEGLLVAPPWLHQDTATFCEQNVSLETSLWNYS